MGKKITIFPSFGVFEGFFGARGGWELFRDFGARKSQILES